MATTRGIIDNSIINYELGFSIPANNQLKGMVIRDLLPAGLTLPVNPTPSWNTLSVSTENIGLSSWVQPMSGLSSTQLLVQLSINSLTVVQPTTETDYVINLPVKVQTASLLTNKSVTNSFELYSSLNTAVEPVVTVTPLSSSGWTPAAPTGGNNQSVDYFTPYNTLLKGNLVEITNTKGVTAYSGCDFNLINSVPSTDADSTFVYNLKFALSSTLAVTGANKPYVFTLGPTGVNYLTETTDYNIASTNDEYNLSLTVTDKLRGENVNVFVPFELETAFTPTTVAQQMHLINPLSLTIMANAKPANIPSLKGFSDVLVDVPEKNITVGFVSKKLD